MRDRIHIVLDPLEKERFRRAAARQGKSLSAWLRELAREELAATEGTQDLGDEQQLRSFFQACDLREQGHEPDWEEQRRVIEQSVAAGRTTT